MDEPVEKVSMTLTEWLLMICIFVELSDFIVDKINLCDSKPRNRYKAKLVTFDFS